MEILFRSLAFLHLPYRNAILLPVLLLVSMSPFCRAQEREIELKLGDTRFVLRERVREGPCDLVFFAPHDDESVCVKAAEEVIEQYGGRLLELKSPGAGGHEDRYLNFQVNGTKARIDPNRIFSTPGIILALNHEDGRNSEKVKNPGPTRTAVIEAVAGFAKVILDRLEIDKQPLIISLHNNRDGASIWMEEYAPKRRRGLYNWNRELDGDDLFITTSIPILDTLTTKGYNIVFEGEGKDDGSLSVYCWKHSPAIPYVNIEAERVAYGSSGKAYGANHAKQQRRMVEAIVIYHLNQTRPRAQRTAIPPPVK